MSSAHDPELISNFFEERIEILDLPNVDGRTGFIQRPIAKPKGIAPSVNDLPDDFDVANASASKAQVYRINVVVLEITVIYEPTDMAVEISVKLAVPIVGTVTIGKGSGNLRQGLTFKLSFKLIDSVEISLRLIGNDAVLFIDPESDVKNCEIKLFSLNPNDG